MLPDRLFLEKSRTLKLVKGFHQGIFPERRLFERDITCKFLNLTIEEGILPLRKFLERSKYSTVHIFSPMFFGIGPEKELFFKDKILTLEQSGSGPSKRLELRLQQRHLVPILVIWEAFLLICYCRDVNFEAVELDPKTNLVFCPKSPLLQGLGTSVPYES